MASIEIDGRNVGKLIGPRGATIKQLQDQYRVRISISKDDNDVRQNFFFFFTILGRNAILTF